MFAESPPIVPKAPDGPLRVIVIGSLAAVAAYLDAAHDGEFEIRVFPGSGDNRTRRRRALRKILPLTRAGDTDLVVASDGSRIARDPYSQFEFAEEARCNGTRVIFVAEGLDTALKSWETRQQVTSLAMRIRCVRGE